MKKVQLTKNQIALTDNEDFERVNQFKWYALWNPCTQSYYATGYTDVSNKTLVGMAGFIMSCSIDKITDHINHITLDNQKHNLRVCTRSENSQNCRLRTNSSSRYKGVCWDKSHKKWKAQIGLKDIFNQSCVQYLGHFNDEEKAALTYDKAAIKHFGEFALLNF